MVVSEIFYTLLVQLFLLVLLVLSLPEAPLEKKSKHKVIKIIAWFLRDMCDMKMLHLIIVTVWISLEISAISRLNLHFHSDAKLAICI